MRVPTRNGVLAAAGGGFQFVNASANEINSAPSEVFSIPSGAQAGDLMFVSCAAYATDTITVTSGSGGAWTKNTVQDLVSGNGYYYSILYRVLTSGDISTGTVTVGTPNGASTCVLAVYRGASAVAVKASQAGNTTDPTLTGFTKNASCKGIVTVVLDRNYTNNPSPPGTFTTRAGPGNFQFFNCELADITNPSNYTNGTNVQWTSVGSTSNASWLLELT
jgi:hypothetical protein